jgi:hypothetical protein
MPRQKTKANFQKPKMKKSIISLIAAGALASVASAQLYIVEGGGTGVKAEFTFTIDDVTDTVTVDIDNTIAGDGGAQGAITGFGFNVPDWMDVSLVSFTATGGAGFAESSWDLGPDFDLEPGYDQDLGVTGAPQVDTIQWGTTAQFVFSFNQDFTGTDGFLGANSLSVRFQSIENSINPESSDKVFGNPEEGGGGGGGGVVPEPSTYGMFGALALLGMMVVRQVRRR